MTGAALREPEAFLQLHSEDGRQRMGGRMMANNQKGQTGTRERACFFPSTAFLGGQKLQLNRVTAPPGPPKKGPTRAPVFLTERGPRQGMQHLFRLGLRVQDLVLPRPPPV